MDLDEFKSKKVKDRQFLAHELLQKIKDLNPVAIHQFGSGTKGYRDEFSDMDIWVTFEDKVIDEAVGKRDEIYKSIAPVLMTFSAD